jgi:hypothetical protein
MYVSIYVIIYIYSISIIQPNKKEKNSESSRFSLVCLLFGIFWGMTFYKGTKNQLGINRLTDSWNGNHRNQLMFTRNQNQIWVRDIKPNQNQLMFTRNWLLHQILGDRVLNSAKKKRGNTKTRGFSKKNSLRNHQAENGLQQ